MNEIERKGRLLLSEEEISNIFITSTTGTVAEAISSALETAADNIGESEDTSHLLQYHQNPTFIPTEAFQEATNEDKLFLSNNNNSELINLDEEQGNLNLVNGFGGHGNTKPLDNCIGRIPEFYDNQNYVYANEERINNTNCFQQKSFPSSANNFGATGDELHGNLQQQQQQRKDLSFSSSTIRFNADENHVCGIHEISSACSPFLSSTSSETNTLSMASENKEPSELHCVNNSGSRSNINNSDQTYRDKPDNRETHSVSYCTEKPTATAATFNKEEPFDGSFRTGRVFQPSGKIIELPEKSLSKQSNNSTHDHSHNHHHHHHHHHHHRNKESKIPVGIAVAWQRLVTTNNSSSSTATPAMTSKPEIGRSEQKGFSSSSSSSTYSKYPARPTSASPYSVKAAAKANKASNPDISNGSYSISSSNSKSGYSSVDSQLACNRPLSACGGEGIGGLIPFSPTSTSPLSRPLPSSSVPPNLGFSVGSPYHFPYSFQGYPHHHQQRSGTPFLEYPYGSSPTVVDRTFAIPSPLPSPHHQVHSPSFLTNGHPYWSGVDNSSVPLLAPGSGVSDYMQLSMQQQLHLHHQQHLLASNRQSSLPLQSPYNPYLGFIYPHQEGNPNTGVKGPYYDHYLQQKQSQMLRQHQQEMLQTAANNIERMTGVNSINKDIINNRNNNNETENNSRRGAMSMNNNNNSSNVSGSTSGNAEFDLLANNRGTQQNRTVPIEVANSRTNIPQLSPSPIGGIRTSSTSASQDETLRALPADSEDFLSIVTTAAAGEPGAACKVTRTTISLSTNANPDQNVSHPRAATPATTTTSCSSLPTELGTSSSSSLLVLHQQQNPHLFTSSSAALSPKSLTSSSTPSPVTVHDFNSGLNVIIGSSANNLNTTTSCATSGMLTTSRKCSTPSPVHLPSRALLSPYSSPFSPSSVISNKSNNNNGNYEELVWKENDNASLVATLNATKPNPLNGYGGGSKEESADQPGSACSSLTTTPTSSPLLHRRNKELKLPTPLSSPNSQRHDFKRLESLIEKRDSESISPLVLIPQSSPATSIASSILDAEESKCLLNGADIAEFEEKTAGLELHILQDMEDERREQKHQVSVIDNDHHDGDALDSMVSINVTNEDSNRECKENGLFKVTEKVENTSMELNESKEETVSTCEEGLLPTDKHFTISPCDANQTNVKETIIPSGKSGESSPKNDDDEIEKNNVPESTLSFSSCIKDCRISSSKKSKDSDDKNISVNKNKTLDELSEINKRSKDCPKPFSSSSPSPVKHDISFTSGYCSSNEDGVIIKKSGSKTKKSKEIGIGKKMKSEELSLKPALKTKKGKTSVKKVVSKDQVCQKKEGKLKQKLNNTKLTATGNTICSDNKKQVHADQNRKTLLWGEKKNVTKEKVDAVPKNPKRKKSSESKSSKDSARISSAPKRKPVSNKSGKAKAGTDLPITMLLLQNASAPTNSQQPPTSAQTTGLKIPAYTPRSSNQLIVNSDISSVVMTNELVGEQDTNEPATLTLHRDVDAFQQQFCYQDETQIPPAITIQYHHSAPATPLVEAASPTYGMIRPEDSLNLLATVAQEFGSRDDLGKRLSIDGSCNNSIIGESPPMSPLKSPHTYTVNVQKPTCQPSKPLQQQQQDSQPLDTGEIVSDAVRDVVNLFSSTKKLFKKKDSKEKAKKVAGKTSNSIITKKKIQKAGKKEKRSVSDCGLYSKPVVLLKIPQIQRTAQTEKNKLKDAKNKTSNSSKRKERKEEKLKQKQEKGIKLKESKTQKPLSQFESPSDKKSKEKVIKAPERISAFAKQVIARRDSAMSGGNCPTSPTKLCSLKQCSPFSNWNTPVGSTKDGSSSSMPQLTPFNVEQSPPPASQTPPRPLILSQSATAPPPPLIPSVKTFSTDKLLCDDNVTQQDTTKTEIKDRKGSLYNSKDSSCFTTASNCKKKGKESKGKKGKDAGVVGRKGFEMFSSEEEEDTNELPPLAKKNGKNKKKSIPSTSSTLHKVPKIKITSVEGDSAASPTMPFSPLTPPLTATLSSSLGVSSSTPSSSPSNTGNDDKDIEVIESEFDNDYNNVWVADPMFAVSAVKLQTSSNQPSEISSATATSADDDDDDSSSSEIESTNRHKRRKKRRTRNDKPPKLSLYEKQLSQQLSNNVSRPKEEEVDDNLDNFVNVKSELSAFVHFKPKQLISSKKGSSGHIKPCLKAEPVVRSQSDTEDEEVQVDDEDFELDLEVAKITTRNPAKDSSTPATTTSDKLVDSISSSNKKSKINRNSMSYMKTSSSKEELSSVTPLSTKEIMTKVFSRKVSPDQLSREKTKKKMSTSSSSSTKKRRNTGTADEDEEDKLPTTNDKQKSSHNNALVAMSAAAAAVINQNTTIVSASTSSSSPLSSAAIILPPSSTKNLPKKRSSRSSTTSSSASTKSSSRGTRGQAALFSALQQESFTSQTDETTCPGKVELESVEELVNEMRILTEIQGLFYTGRLNALQPPDVYGVTLDNERGAPPHLIFSAEEVLEKCLREKKPQGLSSGLRICAYWSPQYSGLYPGRVSSDFNPKFDPDEDLVPIEFDDGDTGMIKLREIRLLSANHPVREYDPNPLLTLEKKHRKRRHSSATGTSGGCTGDHEEPDCGEPYCAKVGKYEEEEDEDDESHHHSSKILYWTWSGLGYKKPKSKKDKNKEFFRGIQRGDEIINVGDAALFISTGNERPFIGRVEKFWEIKGKKMVNVRWFYHPEEVKASAKRLSNLKYPGALFESPHIDENDVQTIAKKCDVLPFADFKQRACATSTGSPRLAKLSMKSSSKPRDMYYIAGFYDPYNYNLTLKDFK